ncbi:MAG: GldG family protein [Verrucomicrobia bacterium]|nr:GldG family protein [Verrucomicrobiota bacterium]
MPDDLDNPPPSFSAARKLGTGFGVLVGVAAFLAIVVMVNFLAARNFRRVSLSEDRVPPLAPVTLQVLAALTNDLHVTLYFDPDETLYAPILQSLRQYANASARVKITTVDYQREPDKATETQRKHNLPPNIKDIVIFAIADRSRIVRQGELSEYDTSKLLSGQSQAVKRKSFTGESYFTSAILTLMESRKLTTYYLRGHNEHDPTTAGTRTGYGKFIELLQRGNGLTPFGLSLAGTNPVPADCSLLVIAGPFTPLHADEVNQLNNYLNRGGRALVLLPENSNSGLEPLLRTWGVELGDDRITDEAGSREGSFVILKNYSDHDIVRPFGPTQDGLVVATPRSVTPRSPTSAGSDAPQVRVLVSTSPSGKAIGNRGSRQFDPRVDKAGVISVAVAVERGGLSSVEGGSTRMVVVGDSFFLGNAMIENSVNRDFAANAINWLVDRPKLVGIAPQVVREYQFNMTDAQTRSVQWILLAGVPGTILGFGLLVWWRRQV